MRHMQKIQETGRSMIEMLGVLAIAGILSVGGIAGFSKAMAKYKAIKTAEEYNLFLQDVLHYQKELVALRKGTDDHYLIAEILDNMKLLPTGWTRRGGTIYDRLNNKLHPFIRKENNRLNFDYYLDSDYAKLLCIAMFTDVLLPRKDILYYALAYHRNEEGTDQSQNWFGNNFCNSARRKCLRDMTITDVVNTCTYCAKDGGDCILIFDF